MAACSGSYAVRSTAPDSRPKSGRGAITATTDGTGNRRRFGDCFIECEDRSLMIGSGYSKGGDHKDELWQSSARVQRDQTL